MSNRSFFLKVGLYMSPLMFVLGWFVIMNPYHVGAYEPGLYDNPFVHLNREMVCYETHQALQDSAHFNAYIFGSSRSQAYRCSDWAKHLPADAVPFHLDASAESITGTWQKIRYLDRTGADIRHALLIVDADFFNGLGWNRQPPTFHSHPLGSSKSVLSYRFAYLRAFLTPEVLRAYFDYRLFGVYKPYMKVYTDRPEYNAFLDPVNCDLHYGLEDQIRSDSLSYYASRKWPRPETERQGRAKPSRREIAMVTEIASIFATHGTDVHIVVSPTFNRFRLSEARLAMLQKYFGADRVHDFGGKNKWTEPLGNYYETTHYRPHLARAIMTEVYGQPD